MNGLDLAALGKRNDLVDGQVSPQRAPVFSDEIGFVRLCTKQSQCIFLGVNGKCADAQVMTGTENADGNLSAICRHHFVKSILRQKTISFDCTALLKTLLTMHRAVCHISGYHRHPLNSTYQVPHKFPPFSGPQYDKTTKKLRAGEKSTDPQALFCVFFVENHLSVLHGAALFFQNEKIKTSCFFYCRGSVTLSKIPVR